MTEGEGEGTTISGGREGAAIGQGRGRGVNTRAKTMQESNDDEGEYGTRVLYQSKHDKGECQGRR